MTAKGVPVCDPSPRNSIRPIPAIALPTNGLGGPLGWFQNAFVYALAHGAARVLLRAGAVLLLWWDQQARIVQVEEL